MAIVYGTNIENGKVPSLDLRFSERKSLVDTISGRNLVTFSRSSVGTYFDSTGTLRTAAANEARFDHNPSTGESLGLLVEEARTNSQTNSTRVELFTPVELNIIPNALLAPDGSFTGCALIGNTANSYKYANNPVGFSVSGTTYSFSFYAKSIGNRTSVFVAGNSSAWGTGSVTFDLSAVTATATGSFTGSITAAGNGWYRCVATRIANASGYGLNIYLGTFQGDGVSGIGIWGLQAEAGSFPTSYIPTPATFTSRASSATFYDANGVIQTASTNVARSAAYFPDSNGVMRPAGLLLEAAGTNLLQYSEQLNTSPWTLNNSASVSANSSVAPDGQTTADTLSGTTADSYVEQTVPWSASGNWTLSFFAKAGTSSRNKIYIVRSASQVHGTNIDWSSGVPSFSTTFGCTAQSEKIGNGWYRISLLLTSVNHTATNFLRITSDFISGTGTVLLWGFQAEQNSYPTSYIATTASTVTRSADVSSSATVTRSADVAQITGTNFSSWYNQSAGTLFLDLRHDQGLPSVFVGAQLGTGLDPRVFQLGNGAPGTSAEAYSSGQYVLSSSGYAGLNVRMKMANAQQLNDAAFSVNGTTALTDTSFTPPIVDRLNIGFVAGAAAPTRRGTFSRLTYWPTRLSDATLVAITK